MESRTEPTRITLARRLKKLSRSKLAEKMVVSVASVTQWETGERNASNRLSDLVLHLDQTEEFLTGSEVPVTLPETVSFRKRYDATRELRDQAAATVDYAAGVLRPALLNFFGNLPPVSVPNLSELREHPEIAAEVLRQEWRLGDAPIKSVVEQFEAKGIKIFWVDTGSPSLSAYCKWIDRDPFIILNTAKRDGCRSRFDACHELAHLVLHRDVNFDTQNMKEIEREADSFASAFLLPKTSFLEDAPRTFNYSALMDLKRTWRVSVQAMVRRLYDLGAFTDYQYQAAFRTMSGWGWRSQPEPLAGPMEPSWIHNHLCSKLEDQDLTPRDFAISNHLSWTNVSELMPVLEARQSNFLIGDPFADKAPLGINDRIRDYLPYSD